MEHLFNSAVRVERLTLTVEDGVATMAYAQATDPDPALNDALQFLRCRLQLLHYRTRCRAVRVDEQSDDRRCRYQAM